MPCRLYSPVRKWGEVSSKVRSRRGQPDRKGGSLCGSIQKKATCVFAIERLIKENHLL
jgi:hypothetical protein